jgi:hypothetical protein
MCYNEIKKGGVCVGYEGLKNRERFASSVDKKLLLNLRALSESTRIPLSRLLDEAIADLLKKHQPPEQD